MAKLHEELIQVNNLKTYFRISRKSVLKAVDDVSFSIKRRNIRLGRRVRMW